MNPYRLVLTALLSVSLLACGGETATETISEPDAPAFQAEAEKQYDLRGVIVDRDPMANTLKIDHEEIGDWMGAMTMSFPVRGADVQSLPEEGETVTATVHVDGTDFWLTDVTIATPAPVDPETPTETDITDPAIEPEVQE